MIDIVGVQPGIPCRTLTVMSRWAGVRRTPQSEETAPVSMSEPRITRITRIGSDGEGGRANRHTAPETGCIALGSVPR